MFRTLTGIGIALALLSSAQAQDRIVVSTQGKSENALRAELHRAAEQVCTDKINDAALVDTDCVTRTYAAALRQVLGVKTSALEPALRTRPAESGF
jgi:hypothetical protein